MHCLCLLFGHFIVPLILMFNTQADYIIDDSNSTISYLGPRAQIPVVNTMQINSSELYDNTVTHSSCATTDDCSVVIPFIGTGINVYGVIRGQLNLSFGVDGNPFPPFIYSDGACFAVGSPPSQPQGCYNSSFFTTQSMPYAAHSLTIYLFTYSGPNPIYGSNSDFFLDYAVISAPRQSSSASPSSTGSATPSSHPKPLGAAIGGAVGGIAAVIALALGVLYYRKGRKRSVGNDADAERTDPSFRPTTQITNIPARPDALHDWSPATLIPGQVNNYGQTRNRFEPETRITPTEATPTAQIPPPSSDSGSVAATGMKSQNSSSGQSTQYAAREAISSAAFSNPSPSMSTGTSLTRLTEEQSSLVQGLMRHNVPLPTVVGAIEGMLTGEQQPGSIRHPQSRQDPMRADSPPEYDTSMQ